MKKDKEIVRAMFDSIAPKYDFLNHFLSLGIDKGWRNKVAKMVKATNAQKVIDVATGTGDLAISIAKHCGDCKITGVDMSPMMLDIAKQKIQKLSLQDTINVSVEDALQMSFEDNSFDALTISFGVRNFENLDKGLSELRRVLKPNGDIFIMEVSTPNGILAAPYMFYFKTVLPAIGRMVSADHVAYSYLSKTVIEFPSGKDFVEIMQKNGFHNIKFKRLTQGIATIYYAKK